MFKEDISLTIKFPYILFHLRGFISPPITFVTVRLTNRDYQDKGPTDPFEGTNTHFHIPCGT